MRSVSASAQAASSAEGALFCRPGGLLPALPPGAPSRRGVHEEGFPIGSEMLQMERGGVALHLPESTIPTAATTVVVTAPLRGVTCQPSGSWTMTAVRRSGFSVLSCRLRVRVQPVAGRLQVLLRRPQVSRGCGAARGLGQRCWCTSAAMRPASTAGAPCRTPTMLPIIVWQPPT